MRLAIWVTLNTTLFAKYFVYLYQNFLQELKKWFETDKIHSGGKRKFLIFTWTVLAPFVVVMVSMVVVVWSSDSLTV
jgi:hypothetical protein